jgi:hypothetical protein
MAKLVLWQRELNGEKFPPLCMRCGEPSCTIVRHRFFWAVPGYGVPANVRQAIVAVPLCRRHRYMWLRRGVWLGLGLVGPATLFLGTMFLSFFPELRPGRPPERNSIESVLVGCLSISLLFSCVIALFALLNWRSMAIRAVEIDGQRIVLEGVAELFVHALQEVHNSTTLKGDS